MTGGPFYYTTPHQRLCAALTRSQPRLMLQGVKTFITLTHTTHFGIPAPAVGASDPAAMHRDASVL
jgi:hypothetical protein